MLHIVTKLTTIYQLRTLTLVERVSPLPSTRLLIWMHERNKTACTSLPEDEHLDVRNMSKTM